MAQMNAAQRQLKALREQRQALIQRRRELRRPAKPETVPEVPRNATPAQVKEIQKWLSRRGYYSGAIDGQEGSVTTNALAKARADIGKQSGSIRDYETRKGQIDDKISGIDEQIRVAEKNVEGTTWGGWARNTAESFGPRVAGGALGFAENRALKKGIERVAQGRANSLISIAKPLEKINYLDPAAYSQAKGRVAAARPYMPPENPALNALARAGGIGGRMAIYSVLPGMEAYEYTIYDQLARDPTASEQERANNRMIANALLFSAVAGGMTGAHAAITPNIPDTAEAEAKVRTAEAMLRNPQGGQLPGSINPGSYVPEPPPPINSLATPLEPAPSQMGGATGGIADLEAQLAAARDPAEIEALKSRINELQGRIDAEAARQAAIREKMSVTRAMSAGTERLKKAKPEDLLKRAKAINPRATKSTAQATIEREHTRIGNLSGEELRAELTALGKKTEGLSRGALMTRLMKAKGLAVPAAITGSAAALGLAGGTNPADAAPRAPGETAAHYLARRAYPAVAGAADIGSYFVPYLGEARLGTDVGRAVAGAINAPAASVMPQPQPAQTLSAGLAAGERYGGRTEVPPLPEMQYADPRFPDPREAVREQQVRNLAAARADELRQQYGPQAEIGAAPPSSFDAAMARLREALALHRMIMGGQPANALAQ